MLGDMGNKRAVRILLECILVLMNILQIYTRKRNKKFLVYLVIGLSRKTPLGCARFAEIVWCARKTIEHILKKPDVTVFHTILQNFLNLMHSC